MKRILTLLALVGAGGCSTVFTASAPSADPNLQYVVGMRGQTPAVFLCPTAPGNGFCRRIALVESW